MAIRGYLCTKMEGHCSGKSVSGLEGEKYVEAVRGLQEGEEVIVAGQYELKDMMLVRVIRRQKTP